MGCSNRNSGCKLRVQPRRQKASTPETPTPSTHLSGQVGIVCSHDPHAGDGRGAENRRRELVAPDEHRQPARVARAGMRQQHGVDARQRLEQRRERGGRVAVVGRPAAVEQQCERGVGRAELQKVRERRAVRPRAAQRRQPRGHAHHGCWQELRRQA
jgi:hypothetical protein